jgi:hypothetical protein
MAADDNSHPEIDVECLLDLVFKMDKLHEAMAQLDAQIDRNSPDEPSAALVK